MVVVNKKVLVFLRLLLGFVFLWAFLDKTFGLGFATSAERAWINGGSPTAGFLTNAVRGPFAEIFNSLAGIALVDWLFMTGLLFIGVTLIFNFWVKLGSLAGTTMLILMYLALIPPENNPLIDDHIIYALVMLLFFFMNKEKKPVINTPQNNAQQRM